MRNFTPVKSFLLRAPGSTVVPSAGLRLVGLEVTALRMTEGPRRLSHRPGATLTHAAIWCSRGVCRAGNRASL